MISQLPTVGSLPLTLLAFIAALSVIVFIHEYGHYIVGRICGIHAEVFSLGFGPTLISWRDKRGTKWQLAALPFGGYVKFLGDKNAASAGVDGEAVAQLSPEEMRHTMHGAPLWARAATVAAGPLFNFLLSILIFTGLLLYSGVATERTVVGQIENLPFGQNGLQKGDHILSIAGIDTPDLKALTDAASKVKATPVVPYVVERAGQTLTVEGPHPQIPLIGGVTPDTSAFDAGLRSGDVVMSIEGEPVYVFNDIRPKVDGSEGKPLAMVIWRDGQTHEITLVPKRRDVPTADGGFETRYLLGLISGLPFKPETRTPGVFEAVGMAGEQTWAIIKGSLSGLWHVLARQISTCNLRGAFGIAEASGAAAAQGWIEFIGFVALLSTGVGLLNLFPIPVLDGGHLVFFAYEAVFRRPPPARALNVLMLTGLTMIMALMLFALSNDILSFDWLARFMESTFGIEWNWC